MPRIAVVRGAVLVAFSIVSLTAGALVAPPVGVFGSLPAEAAPRPPLAVPTALSVADAASASSELAALATAAAFDHPVVIDAYTTERVQVSALPDGTEQMVQNSVPVRVKTAKGWAPIDADLVLSQGYLVPKATSTSVEFGAGGSDVLAKVQTRTGEWLIEFSPFGVLPTPVINGPTATYPNVLPGVDLQLTATAQGMSEVLVIQSAAAAENPKLHDINFQISGSALSSRGGGLATATLSDGSEVLSTTPTWWDSSNGSTADGPAGNASKRPVPQTVDASSISLDAQAAARTSGVQYPVYVDPDWTGALQGYTYVDLAYPALSYWDGANATGQQRTGFVAASYSPDNVNHTARSLWQMDTSGVAGKHILNANFSVTEDWSFNCTASEVDLYTSGAINSSTTWNNQPSLVQYQSNAVVAYGNNSSCPTSAVGFSATSGVQSAAASNATSLTFELRAASETSNVSWKRFAQSATLTINYNTPPSAPTAPSINTPTRSCGTSSVPSGVAGGPIVLQATFADPDAGSNLSGTFYLVDGATTTTYPVAPAAVGVRTASVPSTALTNGHSYSWYVISNDGIDSSPASQTCYFVVDSTIPPTPTVSASVTAVGQPSYAVFGSNPSVPVTFAYWWTNSGLTSPYPNSPIPGTTNVSQALCGTGLGNVRFACPNPTSGFSPLTLVAPTDTTSTLWVVAYGPSGNRSATAGYEVDGTSDTTNVTFGPGHGWVTDFLSSPLPATIPDSNTSGGTATSSEHDVNLNGGVATATGTANVNTGPVFSFPGAGTVGTAGPVVDPSHSFSVSAWIFPTGTAYFPRVIVSENTGGTTGGGFTLTRNWTNSLEFCVSVTGYVFVSGQGRQHPLACADWTGLSLNTWTFVTAIYDSVNAQLRLIVGDTSTPVVVQTVAFVPSTVTSGFQIGGPPGSSQWSGLIDDPTIFPGVTSGSQIDNLYFQSAPQ